MASFQILPPEKFDFAQPKQWQKLASLIRRFRQASDLALKSKETQVNTLIYSMGEEAKGILYSFELSDDDKKKYNTVLNQV